MLYTNYLIKNKVRFIYTKIKLNKYTCVLSRNPLFGKIITSSALILLTNYTFLTVFFAQYMLLVIVILIQIN